MNYMRLLKVLYLADREMLQKTGRPITGSNTVAMERGPVVEEIYDLIRERHRHTQQFARFFKTEGYCLAMHRDPGVTRLTECEIESLQQVAESHRCRDEWEMVKFCHDHLEEWRRNDPGTSSRHIPLEHILEALGMRDCLDEILENEKDREGGLDVVRRIRGVRPQ